MKLPLYEIFLLLLIPLGVGTVASVVIARLFGTGFQDDVPVAPGTKTPALPAHDAIGGKA
jgi:hypothetical protein